MTKAAKAPESQDKYNLLSLWLKPKVESLANNKSSVDPPLLMPRSSGPTQPRQIQLDNSGDSEDHVLVSVSDVQEDIPEIGGIRKPTKTPDQSPTSTKRAHQRLQSQPVCAEIPKRQHTRNQLLQPALRRRRDLRWQV